VILARAMKITRFFLSQQNDFKVKYDYKEFRSWATNHGFTQDEYIHDIFHKDGIEIGRKLDGSIFHGPKGLSCYRRDIESLTELKKFWQETLCLPI